MAGIVFGPLKSRRFGWSLGIDLSNEVKQCNFNCVYCELQVAKPMDKMEHVIPLSALLEAVHSALETYRNTPLDVLTTTANGEPTLYPYLYDFITQLKTPPGLKTLILSNGSRFANLQVQEALMHYDIVKFSLDAVLPKAFAKVDKPSKQICLEQLLEGIVDFSARYKGMLIAEVLLVKGVNDGLENIQAIVDFLRPLKLARIDLSTIDRPPSHNTKPLSTSELLKVATYFEGLPVSLALRDSSAQPNFSLADLEPQSFLDLLKRRPLSIEEAHFYLPTQTLQNLYQKGVVEIRKIGAVDFYYPC
ncbi:radical SAM protein [Helicobacter cynogastricus]|uniref:radical SAM protein n=1 Tax=Helicobacter cynogastricus TaxID=329937 RepID=UPI000CF06A36|nr:radical SAM protein [Helicobacter cynogastricus]